MKIPYPFTCPACGNRIIAEGDLREGTAETSCSACGVTDKILLGLDYTPGPKLLVKSRYELTEHEDWSASIIFAAMAVDCELSFNHIKWRRIDDMTEMIDTSKLREVIDDEVLERELRRFGGTREKIEGVCRVLDSRGIDGFVRDHPELKKAVEDGFPSLQLGDLADGIQRALFRPRNRIVHLADTEKITNADATRCFNIATLSLWIIDEMDKERRAGMKIK